MNHLVNEVTGKLVEKKKIALQPNHSNKYFQKQNVNKI